METLIIINKNQISELWAKLQSNYNKNVQQPYLPPKQPVYYPLAPINPYNNVSNAPVPPPYMRGTGLLFPFCD